MPKSPSGPKAGRFRRGETFNEALNAVITSEHFGSRTAFAKQVGVKLPQIRQYEQSPRKIQPASIDKLRAAIDSAVLRERLLAAWERQFFSDPVLPEGLPLERVLSEIEALFEAGFYEQAIRAARTELKGSRDFPRWFAIAERLEPLYLRVGRLAKAAALRAEIERRAREVRDDKAVVASLAMGENILQSIESATPRVVDRAHWRTELAANDWKPQTAKDKRSKELRLRNMKRVRGHQLLGYVQKHGHSPLLLEDAKREVESSFEDGDPAYMIAAGLEMRARIEAAQGELRAAAYSLEDLEEFGVEKGWDIWAKSRLTLARLAEQDSKKDEAIKILTELSEYCRATGSERRAREAQEEIARLKLGF